MRAVAAAACLALLGACASYQPISQPRALNIAPGVWRLSTRGAWAPGAQVGALRRAADLTLAEGGDWFRVLDRERGSDGDDWGFGSGSTDVGDNLSDPGAYALSTLEIEIGHGSKPEGRDVYDARQVAASTRGAAPYRSAPTAVPA
ncbi:MAG: hypothetical protein INR64_02760 [Caulobacteraceae bacterium]|nr:hypothetical protein [Caulobacter sp.]